MKQQHSTIYLVTNSVNGKIYVGRTCHRKEDRWRQHVRSVLKSATHHLSRAIARYGESSFSLSTLEEVSHDCAIHREIHWILAMNSMDPLVGYNLTTASGADTDRISALTRRKLGAASKRYWNNIDPAGRSEVLSKRLTGLPKSDAHAATIALAKAGRPLKTAHTTSDYVGVRLTQNGKWETNCYVKGVQYSMVCVTEEDAARTYDRYALALRGAAARLNFEEDRRAYLSEDLSAFTRSRRKVTSKYLHVSFNAQRSKWCVFIKGKGYGRYATEEAAATVAATTVGCQISELIKPTTRKKSRPSLAERASLPASA